MEIDRSNCYNIRHCETVFTNKCELTFWFDQKGHRNRTLNEILSFMIFWKWNKVRQNNELP